MIIPPMSECIMAFVACARISKPCNLQLIRVEMDNRAALHYIPPAFLTELEMAQDSPTSLRRLGAILRELKSGLLKKSAAPDNLTKVRADVRKAAELLLAQYADGALERARLLESRPDATYFARLVTREVEQIVAAQAKR